MSELFVQAKQNASFLVACIIITALMILAAKVAERFLPSRRKLSPARRVATIGMCTAIATVLYMIDFPVPFLAHPSISWTSPRFPSCSAASSSDPPPASSAWR